MEVEFDIIVTDNRMPEIDGAEFLRRALSYSPQSVRFVLSGQADERTILRCLRYTHQHVAKPCDVSALVQRFGSVLDFENTALSRHLRSHLCSLPAIPVKAGVLRRFHEELSSASPSSMVINECIASDAGLSIKLLQVTNSSFFGHPERIVSPARAAARLGIETLRKMVFEAAVFEELLLPDELTDLKVELEQVEADALLDSALEETLSVDELLSKIAERCAPIGMMCLAHWSASNGLAVSQQELRHVSNAATAYLLSILGLPPSLTERMREQSSCRSSVCSAVEEGV
jgi:CheY-like chemotaxis protein